MRDLKKWCGCAPPDMPVTKGRYIEIAPLQLPDHGDDLFAALTGAANDELWRYIPIGPFDDAAALGATLAEVVNKQNWQTHLLRDARTGAAVGMASFMRIRPEQGSAEIGCIMFSKALQRTPAATEAMYLIARHIFDARGYRRYEWKCNDANEASKRAALRLGFTYEGTFRQDMVVKGESRDTAWFSMLDHEWPDVKAAFEAWLAPENFDNDERQRKQLEEFRRK
ncbi:MAG: GNAT family N-acetyltransferase [Marinicaulis sp.]|nr:GNAT family N-acetyltransferase [Marinicaulis sp.]